MRRAVTRAVSAAVIAAITFAVIAAATTPASARERTYYVGADEVVWNMAPSGMNLEAGTALPPLIPGQIGRSYHKLLYREYTDGSFRSLAPVAPDMRYLGYLGPLMRAEVGDTIVVVFKNHTKYPLDIVPHGLVVSAAPSKPVKPGGVATYHWSVPDRSGPGPMDESSFLWTYTPSNRDTSIETTGLIGPIIVTKRGMARADGSPTDVDREFVVGFREDDESFSTLFHEDLTDPATNPHRVSSKAAHVPFTNIYVTLNGFIFGNMPMLTMRRGERVRWYLFDSESPGDFHAPTWTGNTVLWNGNRVDSMALGNSDRAVGDMVPDNIGTWQFYCTLNIHLLAGMEARYRVTK